ncbi:hypothetical protein [Evansella cellulosilytica]|uniref:Branched-chain amino acid ABC transporter substrate-binding protein n=1 Tax=Evansella cellulosilytica (strain ATCC 21833 / DSM 2522 / FERM P-1141 / JCM 9156 / N-4) TaxID=649639 RepID=E6TVS1_EVAC2|nr:hypothetical protein [Evansella cellulosilytica]ADU32199.1 hypothetical protein Bcell_3966 [Evansella cellulosilytica DSM 2522]
MKKITDERLLLQNLINIRIVYIIQTIGIIGILGYDLVSKGFDEMRENPLWLLLIITGVTSAYLSMSISADYENNKINPQKSLSISLVVLLLISTVIGFFVSLTDGFAIINGVMIGGIIFVCGLIPIVYIYNLRKKRQDENNED